MVNLIEQGNIIYLDFNPQRGYEQMGRRPALVVSNDVYNRFSNLTYVCPITSTENGHPFHVILDERTDTRGSILCEQLKALDLEARNAIYEEKIPNDLMEEVLSLIKSFF